MAAPTARRRPVRTLIALGVIIVVMAGALAAGIQWSKATAAPKLALDLEGGTEIILTPVPEAQASGQVTSTTISQAIDVIRQRIDASGVAEAQITSQGSGGGAKIVVALPGNPDEQTINLVTTSAQMEFRPVLQQGAPAPAATATPTPSPTDTTGATPAPAATGSPAATPTATAAATANSAETAAPTPTPSPTATGSAGAGPANPSDATFYVTPEIQKQFDNLDCTNQANRKGGVNGPADQAFVTCAQDGGSKLILGPVELEGRHISGATSGLQILPNGTTGTDWVVNLKLDGEGTTKFAATTTRLAGYHKNGQSPLDQFAVVLDGLVVSAPSVNEIIPNGQAVISGSFTRTSAATLANQLSFGSLPVSFQVESKQHISATLGSEQLQRGLVAGLIGLVLVFIYSLFQYRALGFLTVGSLVVAGVITYLSIALLSWGMGYRLSLAGVAGLIVAIGFTADSFIIYFERIRDELRDGRSLGGAVERGWVRARRTVLAAKGVNLVSAVVLYYLAVGGVQGFAFTLGLTTIIDVAVVFWFTHPVMEIISKVPFFRDGHRWSGLSPDRLRSSGIRYVGAGKFQTPQDAAASEPAPEVVPIGAPSTPAAPTDGMTIAERRVAARAQGAPQAAGKRAAGEKNEETR